MWEKWRRETINWPAFALVTVFLIGLFIGLHVWNNVDRAASTRVHSDLQVQLSRAESQRSMLKNDLTQVGSKPYIETRARSELSYLRPGEIRFEVINPENLDMYTDEELQRFMGEKAMGDK